MLPAEGATNVPTNTAIWVPTSFLESVVLTDTAAGTTEALVCINLGDTLMCRPAAPLLPNRAYHMEGWLLQFTTGNGPDNEIPQPPAETGRRYYSSNGRGIALDDCDSGGASGVVVLQLRAGDAIVVVDVDESVELQDPFEPVTVVAAPTASHRGDEVWVGKWSCVNNRSSRPGDRFPLRAGAFDLSGNFSGWVRLEDAHIPWAPPGCSNAGQETGVLNLLVLVGLALARRRPGPRETCRVTRC